MCEIRVDGWEDINIIWDTADTAEEVDCGLEAAGEQSCSGFVSISVSLIATGRCGLVFRKIERMNKLNSRVDW